MFFWCVCSIIILCAPLPLSIKIVSQSPSLATRMFAWSCNHALSLWGNEIVRVGFLIRPLLTSRNKHRHIFPIKWTQETLCYFIFDTIDHHIQYQYWPPFLNKTHGSSFQFLVPPQMNRMSSIRTGRNPLCILEAKLWHPCPTCILATC